MRNVHHAEILKLIKKDAGMATKHTFQDSYPGITSRKYAINSPSFRKIAKEWMNAEPWP